MKTLLSIRNRTHRQGMTLIELLVVMSIMVMLVAVSIPVFKPMLESQRTAMAARTVAGALQRARVKAMEEQKNYGLEFVRFTEGNAENVSIQLRLMRAGKSFVTPEDMRVAVKNGTISVYRWNNSTRIWDQSNPDTTWDNNVEGGYQIQLGRQGRTYDLATPTRLGGDYSTLTLPDQNGTDWAVEAIVTRKSVAALVPQVVLPRGTVVDLRYSGTYSDTSPGRIFFDGSKEVSVMFSPAGYVEEIETGAGNKAKINETVYFCVGEWERQGLDDEGNTYAEDGRNNLLMPSNYWVTVNPKSGQVRITEFAAPDATKLAAWQNAAPVDKPDKLKDMVNDARKFATESAQNVGGF